MRADRTADGHHWRPPSAVGVPSAFSSAAISSRLLPAVRSARMRLTSSGASAGLRPALSGCRRLRAGRRRSASNRSSSSTGIRVPVQGNSTATVFRPQQRFQPVLSGERAIGRSASAEQKPAANQRVFAQEAEGEGFEPSIRLTTDNGFRDRRIRPLCHPSASRLSVAIRRTADTARPRERRRRDSNPRCRYSPT